MKRLLLILLLLVQCLLNFTLLAEPLAEARTLLEANETQKALEILSSLDKENLSAEAEFLLADAFLRSNKLEKAIKHSSKALQLDPKVSEHHMIFAEAQGLKLASGDGSVFKKMGMVKRVRKSFEAAVKLDPKNIRAREGLAQFYLMAPGIAGGSKKKALVQAKAIFEVNKQKGYPLLAQIYSGTKKPKQARETLTQWQKEFPNDWNAVIAMVFYEQSLDNHNKSYELLKSWLESKPNDLAALYQVGRLAATSSEYLDEGAIALQTYISKPVEKFAPDYEWAHYRIAMIYKHKNELELASVHIEKGLELNPNNEQLQKLKAEL